MRLATTNRPPSRGAPGAARSWAGGVSGTAGGRRMRVKPLPTTRPRAIWPSPPVHEPGSMPARVRLPEPLDKEAAGAYISYTDIATHVIQGDTPYVAPSPGAQSSPALASSFSLPRLPGRWPEARRG